MFAKLSGIAKIRLKICAFVLAPALAGVWAISHLHREMVPARFPAAEEATKSRPVQASQTENSLELGGAYRFKPGSRYVYRFDRKIDISGFSKSIPEIAYGGELSIDVVRGFAGGFEAILSEKLSNGAAAAAPSDVAIRVRVLEDAKKVELGLPDLRTEEETQHANLLKDLVALWLFPLEQDTTGTYEAKYEPVQANGDLRSLKKSKVAYLKISADTVKPEIVFSEHYLEWRDSEGIPRRIQGQESTTLGHLGTNSSLTMSSASSYSIAFTRVEISQTRESAAQASLTGSRWHASTLELSGNASSRRANLDEKSRWAELAASLDPISLQGLSHKAQLALFGDLLHELKTFPQNVASLVNLLSPSVIQAGPQSPLFKMAVGALATVGSAEAQADLLALYNDPNCAIGGKGTVLGALTTTQAPLEPSVREFLLNATQDSNSGIATGAAFALGSSLQNAPADETTQKAIATIESAPQTTVADQRVLLDVIGNSGRPEFLPQVESVIQNDQADPSLRSKAVYSLRFMPGAQASSLLVGSLGDSDPGVRLAAANAIQLAPWSPSFVAPLQSCASSEAVSAVQSACQTALHRAM